MIRKLAISSTFIFSSLIPAYLAAKPMVDIQTNAGTISVELEKEKAPITVANFLTYVDEGFYSGTLFHRVIKNFVIQGGGFSLESRNNQLSLVQKATHKPIELETNTGLNNTRGTIAMARTNTPNSATSQFFINVVDNTPNFPSPGYAVFGHVTEGMEIVDSINSTETDASDFPKFFIFIQAIRPRQAQLKFSNLKNQYQIGEKLTISLDEENIIRDTNLDLWVAVQIPNGSLLFFNPQSANGLDSNPTPFNKDLPKEQTHHNVFEFNVPQGLGGHYNLYAAFMKPGSSLNQISTDLRSNLASASLDIQ